MSDAGVGKKKKKKRGHSAGCGGGGHRPGGDDADWQSSGGGEETEPQRLVQLSAADRRLEWRGDDTSPPKQSLDMSNSAESRSLDNSEIRSVISSRSGGVPSCVVRAATNTDLSGTMLAIAIVAELVCLDKTVAAAALEADASVAGAVRHHRGRARCLLRLARTRNALLRENAASVHFVALGAARTHATVLTRRRGRAQASREHHD